MAKKNRVVGYRKAENDRLRYLAQRAEGRRDAWPSITVDFNRQAKTLGWPKRSRAALQARWWRLRRKDQKVTRSRPARSPFGLNGLSSQLKEVSRANAELRRVMAKLRKAIKTRQGLIAEADRLVAVK